MTCVQRRLRSDWANVFAVHMKKGWVLSYPFSAQRRLIRLGRCPCWSESSLGAKVILLVLSRTGLFVILFLSCRWDDQRVREEKIVEKLKDRENSIYKKKQHNPVESFYPRLEDSKFHVYMYFTRMTANNKAVHQAPYVWMHRLIFLLLFPYEPRHEKTSLRGLRPGKTQSACSATEPS